MKKFEIDPICPSCGRKYLLEDTNPRYCEGSFFRRCYLKEPHLHYQCKLCSHKWETSIWSRDNSVRRVRKKVTRTSISNYCRTCDDSGIIERKNGIFKCPDCQKGEKERQYWGGKEKLPSIGMEEEIIPSEPQCLVDYKGLPIKLPSFFPRPELRSNEMVMK